MDGTIYAPGFLQLMQIQQGNIKNLKADVDRCEAHMREQVNMLQKRLIAGETTGDPIADLVIRTTGRVEQSEFERFRAFEKHLQGKKGQLVALRYPSTVKNRHDWELGNVRAVRFGVLAAEQLAVSTSSGRDALEFPCVRCVVTSLPLDSFDVIHLDKGLFKHSPDDYDIPIDLHVIRLIHERGEPVESDKVLFVGDDEVCAFLENDNTLQTMSTEAYMNKMREALEESVHAIDD